MKHALSGILIVLATQALGAPIDLGTTQNKVSFLAIGKPAAIKIRGEASKTGTVSGSLAIGKTISGEVVVSLDNFDTGIELRNHHMKETYLETAKHPRATLKLANVPVTGDANAPGFQWSGPFEGTLALHGTEKPVKGSLKLTRANEKWKGDFSFSFELGDFGVDTPTYLGIVVSKDVQIEASFQQ